MCVGEAWGCGVCVGEEILGGSGLLLLTAGWSLELSVALSRDLSSGGMLVGPGWIAELPWLPVMAAQSV